MAKKKENMEKNAGREEAVNQKDAKTDASVNDQGIRTK